MSDYEGDGWEPFDVDNFSDVVPPLPSAEEFSVVIGPEDKGDDQEQVETTNKNGNWQSFRHIHGNGQLQHPLPPRPPVQRNGFGLPEAYRPTIQSTRHLPQRMFRRQANPLDAPANPLAIILRLDSYQRYLTNKAEPDDVYEMMHTFNDFCKAIRHRTSEDSLWNGRMKLAEICKQTEAFIEVPSIISNTLSIWGKQEQIQQARSTLRRWELSMKRPGQSDTSRLWPKTKAFDGRQEHRNMQSELLKQQQDMFQMYADNSSCKYELRLVWPEGYDLEQFILAFDYTTIQQLRRKFMCRITHETTNTRMTVIAAQNEDSVLAVWQRLQNLLKEMVARKKRGIHLKQCQLPSPRMYKDRVELKPIKPFEDLDGWLLVPALCGRELPQAEVDSWSQLKTQVTKTYRRTTKTALRSSLAGLHVSKKHVRMRVTFGDLGFWRTKDPRPEEESYQIDEFIAMLQKPETTMVQSTLLRPGQETFALVDCIMKISQFGEPSYAWAVHFDFAETGGYGTIRLESEFEPASMVQDEPERRATRWLNYKSEGPQGSEELLEVNVMDLERLDYQFHVGAVSLLDKSTLSKEYLTFEDNVEYKSDPKRLKARPRRRAVFPPGNRALQQVKEISVARFPFKGGDGTFELRRIDVFGQQLGAISPIPKRIEWRGAFYYKGWDHLMSEFAYMEPGNEVTWAREFETFFPPVTDPDFPQMLPQGYKNFTKEVEEIQVLLTAAVAETATAARSGLWPTTSPSS